MLRSNLLPSSNNFIREERNKFFSDIISEAGNEVKSQLKEPLELEIKKFLEENNWGLSFFFFVSIKN